MQFSNSSKSCHQSEKDGTIVKQSNLSTVRKKKRGAKRATSQRIQQKLRSNQTLSQSKKKTVQYLDIGKTCHNSEKDSTILKQCQNLKTEKYGTILKTKPKPVTSQKKMVQYSNRAKTCHQSEKEGRILQQCQNLSPVRKDGTIVKQSNLATVRKKKRGAKRGRSQRTKQKT